MTVPVSVVVMTRNEAANLPLCLPALAPFAEVFVVDSDSTDGTVAIARAHAAVVVPFRWNGAYPKKKQWCLDRLPFAHDWVFFVDADERPTPALVREVAALMAAGPRAAGYYVDGQPVFLGRRLRFGAWNRKLALLDRRRARFAEVDDLDVAAMWEVEGHYQPIIDGPVHRLRHPLLHDDRKPLSAWFDRHNRYSDWEAALAADGRRADLDRQDRGHRCWLKRGLAAVPLRPLAVFLHAYVWRLGMLDGAAGLHHAVSRAFYHWQIAVKRRAAAAATRSPAAGPCRRPAP